MEITTYRNNTISHKTSEEILAFISKEFQYDFGSLLKTDYRFIGRINNHIVAHAALTVRDIEINAKIYDSLLLGRICISLRLRKTGLGSQLLNFITSYSFNHNYDLILLNCGDQIVDFYIKNGFSQISATASYVRENRVVVDEDPVLCFILDKEINIDDLKCNTIFFGEDL